MNGRRNLRHLSILPACLLCFMSFSAMADTLHEVGQGETLSTIASYYKMTVTDIINANGLNITQIYPGQLLKIPYNPNVSYTTTPQYQYPNGGYNTNYGYTNTQNAPQGGVSYPQYPNSQYVNQGYPNSKYPNPNYANPNYANQGYPNTATNTPTVNSEANAKAILGSNGNKNSTLKPFSPYPGSTTVSQTGNHTSGKTRPNNLPPKVYKVQSGDSLYIISKRYNITINSIAKLNNISSNARLYVGQTLNLPDVSQSVQYAPSRTSTQPVANRPSTTQTPSPSRTVTRPEKSIKYRVQRGDTLSGIATRYGISLNELASVNEVSRNYRVRYGETIIVPGKNTIIRRTQPNPTQHKVQYGEGLIIIANKYNISHVALAQANGLSPSSRLIVGQVLKLPVAGATRGGVPTQHKVVAGEGLITIANKYHINQFDLAQLNGLQPYDNLYIGQVLKLPANAKMPTNRNAYGSGTY